MKRLKILSLCDYSGAWSKPYRDAGYEVIQIDLQSGSGDARLLQRERNVHGILAMHLLCQLRRLGAKIRTGHA